MGKGRTYMKEIINQLLSGPSAGRAGLLGFLGEVNWT